jgi:hypothetical protein
MKLARDVLRLMVHSVEWLPSGVLRFSFEEGVKEPVSDFNGKNGSEIDLNPVEFCAESRKLVPSFLLQRLKARGHADPERLWLLVLCFALSQSRATGNVLT